MATLVSRITDLAIAIRERLNLIMPRLLPSGGVDGQVLTKNGSEPFSSEWRNAGGLASEISDSGLVFAARSATPPPAADGKLNIHARRIANRAMPGWVGAAGVDTVVQPILGMNKIISFSATGNTSTPGTVLGTSTFSATGTATSRAAANQNSIYQRMRRIAYVSSASAGSACGVKTPYSHATFGDGAGLGGFFSVTRFAISDAAPVAGARMFVGMDTSGAAAGDIEPSAINTCLGVGHGTSDTNFKIFWGNGSPQGVIDLGADFPIESALNSSAPDVYELVMFSSPLEVSTAYVKLTRLNTGHTITHQITGLASPSTGLNLLRIQRSNNATALAVAVDLASFYFETDY